jgi:hypothetical protein
MDVAHLKQPKKDSQLLIGLHLRHRYAMQLNLGLEASDFSVAAQHKQ